MAHTIVHKNELPHSGSAHRFEGYRHGGADVQERTQGHRLVPLYAFATVQVLQKGGASLPSQPAAVHRQDGAMDKVARRRGEQDDGALEVVGLAVAACRYAGQQRRGALLVLADGAG
jgi:hypothetical protein